MLIAPTVLLMIYAFVVEGNRAQYEVTPVQHVIEGCELSTIQYMYRPAMVTMQDIEMMVSAQKRCVVHYPKSPCLRSLVKETENNDYRAVCVPKGE